ncbi:cobalt ABC transporter, ATPase subunit [Methanolacinia petrolearia DSM 11571]|uniref:ABC transporter ATP-binding protein n=1 Tax=Methanolacinia petrolearia (strain DSM 11571 / OCM 486 / SEBR 4847) TaxID=679926 RepID=E1RIN1_METP4|nr:ATP-binding cassette domain-containing protein [Methanolacinia petrolearia]ADN36623.1 cobalt ABC transporter, ATPase subunit [Methanolacinia petrolearia DSM 11571]
MHILETRNLKYSYNNDIEALKGINFIAGRKQKIAIIGANGAGKSTLFKHFNGILTPSSGEVLVHGEPISKSNLKEIRKTVGIVFQNSDDQIFSPTVEEDIAFGPTNLGLDEETIQHRVNETLRLLSIEHLRDRVPHHLSGGEKKRVAIAGVLAMEPQVIVLDEPTAGLDPRGVKDLIGFLNELPEKYGMTIIFSTHSVELVPEIADYVYVLDKGAIVAQGGVRDVFGNEELLNEIGLEVPVFPRLIKSLNRRGMNIDMAFTFDETEDAIAREFSRLK